MGLEDNSYSEILLPCSTLFCRRLSTGEHPGFILWCRS